MLFGQGIGIERAGAHSSGLGYLKTDSVFDGGNVAALTQPDLSGNGNTATLNSAGYVELTASVDWIDLGDVTSAGAVTDVRLWAKSSSSSVVYIGIDGVNSNLLVITADDTWQQVTTSMGPFSPTNLQINANNGTPQAYSIDVAWLELLDASGNVLDRVWLAEGEEGATLTDYPCISEGGLVGSYEGVPVAGAKETTIPQLAVRNWNERMWFDDTNRVNILNLAINGDFYVEFTAIPTSVSGTQGIFLESSGGIDSVALTALNQITWTGASTADVITLDSSLTLNRAYTFRFDRVGTTLSIRIDGILQTNTATISSTDWDVLYIGGFNRFVGSIYDIDLNGQAAYVGHGADTIDWKDTIGSNDGTPTSSTTVLIPESNSTAGQDAFGNAIGVATRRPNSRATNFRGDDYAVVADDASLDSMNSFWAWVYYDGDNIIWWDLSDGVGTIEIEASGGNLLSTLTTPTYYVGDATTPVAATASLGSAGWKFIGVTFVDFSPTADLRYYGHQGHKVFYSETLTLADFEQSRNATKGTY